MALTFFWSCEDTAAFDGDPNYNAGTLQTPVAGGTVTIDASAAIVGSAGILANAAGENFQFDTTTDIFDVNVGSIGFLLRASTIAGDQQIIQIRGSAAADQYLVKWSSDGNDIVFAKGDPDTSLVEVSTTVNTLTTGVTYGVICRWDQPSGNLLRIEVYSTPTGTPSLIEGVTSTAAFTAPADLAASGRFRIGDTTGLGAIGFFDNIFASKVYAEPIESNFSITSYTGYSAGGSPTPGPSLQTVFTPLRW